MEGFQIVAQTASAALISSIWQGCLLTAFVWLFLKLTPRMSAGVRFAIWSALFVAVALLPGASILSSHRADPLKGAYGIPAVGLDYRWAFAIAGLWAMLAFVQLVRLGGSALRLHGIYRRSQPVLPPPAVEAILRQPGARRARLCSSSEIDQPCVIGFLAPRILIPEWLLKHATPSEIEQIVLHESAHLGRLDDWTNLAQRLAVMFFPLNPVLFWIERRLCAEREIACDEQVVLITRSPRAYAACLTNLAQQRLSRRAMAAALSLRAWERRSQLTDRVESLLVGGAKLSPMKTRALAFALMSVTAAAAVKLGSTAQLVSFISPQRDGSFALQDYGANPRPRYQNVVFHPKPAADTLPTPLADYDSAAPFAHAAVAPARRPAVKPAARHALRRASKPAGGVESIVIVTRWETPAGAQLTRIDQVVRISSVVPTPAGWFVVQL